MNFGVLIQKNYFHTLLRGFLAILFCYFIKNRASNGAKKRYPGCGFSLAGRV